MTDDSLVIKKRAAIITNNVHCGRHVQYYSTIEKYLKFNGWFIADDLKVNKIIICSCGFHDAMYEKVIRALEDIRRTDFLEKNIIIMGCLTKIHEMKLKADFNGQLVKLHHEELLDNIIQAKIPFKEIQPVNAFNVPDKCSAGNKLGEKFHIKISEGCLKECTFCVINKAKGYIKSFPPENIAEQVKLAIKLDRKKIHLMGEDTFAYGIDIGTDIIKLIEYIKAMDQDLQLSFGYLHTRWLKKYAAEIISLCKKRVLKELQIGFQHINERLLKKMGRPTRFSEIYDIICQIKKANPDFYFIADIIVGFPGETEEMFEQLLDFFKRDNCINKVKHFAYSDVEGAPSTKFKDKLPREIIASRWDSLDKILGERSYAADTQEARIDNQTFRITRYDDYSFCKNTFDEEVEGTAAPRVLTLAKSNVLAKDKGYFEF